MLPHQVQNILSFVRKKEQPINPVLHDFLSIFIYVNATANPLVYGGLNSDFRRAYRKMFVIIKQSNCLFFLNKVLFSHLVNTKDGLDDEELIDLQRDSSPGQMNEIEDGSRTPSPSGIQRTMSTVSRKSKHSRSSRSSRSSSCPGRNRGESVTSIGKIPQPMIFVTAPDPDMIPTVTEEIDHDSCPASVGNDTVIDERTHFLSITAAEEVDSENNLLTVGRIKINLKSELNLLSIGDRNVNSTPPPMTALSIGLN